MLVKVWLDPIYFPILWEIRWRPQWPTFKRKRMAEANDLERFNNPPSDRSATQEP